MSCIADIIYRLLPVWNPFRPASLRFAYSNYRQLLPAASCGISAANLGGGAESAPSFGRFRWLSRADWLKAEIRRLLVPTTWIGYDSESADQTLTSRHLVEYA